jgi:hypothetical protein
MEAGSTAPTAVEIDETKSREAASCNAAQSLVSTLKGDTPLVGERKDEGRIAQIYRS